MAAQLTGTKGPLRRVEEAWMMRATCSLPTPVSPVMRTGRSPCRSGSIWRYRSRMTAEPPGT
jgi:hypothetical protein